jgi:predicted AlkP superfamily phosphohydrolase/phosphomutase
MKKDPNVMMMGLDAATCTVVRPWMAEGCMPNLAKLVNGGVSGRVESITPPARPRRNAEAVTADEESAKVEKRLQSLDCLE